MLLLLHGYSALAVAICCQICFGQMSIWGVRRKANMPVVGLTNYVLAAVVSSVLALIEGWSRLRWPLFALSIVNGLGLALSFSMFIRLLPRIGISIPAAVVRSAILLPIIAAAMVWSQWPSMNQWVGIGLIIVAIPLVSGSKVIRGDSHPAGIALLAMMLFLFQGLPQFSWIAFSRLLPGHSIFLFSGLSFAVAAMVMMADIVRQRKMTTNGEGKEWVPGICLGMVNVGGLVFMVTALHELHPAFVLPIASCCGVTTTVLLARWLWDERLDLRAICGLALALTALVVLNL